mgnify:CR=1 FL=1
MAGILGRLPTTDAPNTRRCSLSDARRSSSRQGLRKRFRKIRKELADKYGCPFAFESAFISLQDSDVTIEMERFLYGVARSYSECFRVYGENESFEWQQLADEDPVLFTRTGELEKVDILDEDSEKSSRGSEIVEKRIQIPDYAHLLPKEIASFTTNTVYNNENTHLSFTQGGGHGGSHPHLVHEFIRSILEDANLLSMTSWALTGQVPESVRTNPL